jgi:hypothetical protein
MTAQARKATGAQGAFRDLEEESAAQAKENLEMMTAAGEEATRLLKQKYATTVEGTQEYGAKVLEFINANINTAVEQVTKLMSVKSPMEFFGLSTDYAKQQVGILTRQAQELAAIVQRMIIAKDR